MTEGRGTEWRGTEGREGGDQARFFYVDCFKWFKTSEIQSILCCEHLLCVARIILVGIWFFVVADYQFCFFFLFSNFWHIGLWMDFPPLSCFIIFISTPLTFTTHETSQHSPEWNCTVLCSTALYCTVLYCTVDCG